MDAALKGFFTFLTEHNAFIRSLVEKNKLEDEYIKLTGPNRPEAPRA